MKYGALSALLIASINMQAAQEGTTRYTILTQSPEQHIQHFGASDAWSMQFLGLWSEKQQEQILGHQMLQLPSSLEPLFHIERFSIVVILQIGEIQFQLFAAFLFRDVFLHSPFR